MTFVISLCCYGGVIVLLDLVFLAAVDGARPTPTWSWGRTLRRMFEMEFHEGRPRTRWIAMLGPRLVLGAMTVIGIFGAAGITLGMLSKNIDEIFTLLFGALLMASLFLFDYLCLRELDHMRTRICEDALRKAAHEAHGNDDGHEGVDR